MWKLASLSFSKSSGYSICSVLTLPSLLVGNVSTTLLNFLSNASMSFGSILSSTFSLFSSPSFFSSSLASFCTDAYISLAFSSLGTKSGTLIELAFNPTKNLNFSDLGFASGIGILKVLALRQANDEINK